MDFAPKEVVDDIEKAKTIHNCELEDKTVQNSCNELPSCIEPGPPLSSLPSGDNRNHKLVDSVPTTGIVGEEKSNDGRDNVVCDKGKEKLVDSGKDIESGILHETEAVSRRVNLLLQKLTQLPRYFNPPASTWITCFLCGEGNHIAAECTNRKRKKPCFICADPGHHGRNCMKVNKCFICHRKGHLAMDCRRKDRYSKSCLKCGASGHDMFSCDNAYCSKDLKNIRCCVCKEFGHLCCLDYTVECAGQVSCYTCGKSGHLGSDCTEFHEDTRNAQLAASVNKQEETVKSVEEGNLKGAEQRDGSITVESGAHMPVEAGEEGNLSAEKRNGSETVESRAHMSAEAGEEGNLKSAEKRNGSETVESRAHMSEEAGEEGNLKSAEKRSGSETVESRAHMSAEAGEEGNLKSAEKRDGSAIVESTAHMSAEADRAKQNMQRQRVDVPAADRTKQNKQRQRVDAVPAAHRAKQKKRRQRVRAKQNMRRQRVDAASAQGWRRPWDGAATVESGTHMSTEADRAKQNTQRQRVDAAPAQGWHRPWDGAATVGSGTHMSVEADRAKQNTQTQRVDAEPAQGWCRPWGYNAQMVQSVCVKLPRPWATWNNTAQMQSISAPQARPWPMYNNAAQMPSIGVAQARPWPMWNNAHVQRVDVTQRWPWPMTNNNNAQMQSCVGGGAHPGWPWPMLNHAQRQTDQPSVPLQPNHEWARVEQLQRVEQPLYVARPEVPQAYGGAQHYLS